MDALKSIRTDGDKIEIVNQLLLPHTIEYVNIQTIEEAHDAIKSMKVSPLAPEISSLTRLICRSAVHLPSLLSRHWPSLLICRGLFKRLLLQHFYPFQKLSKRTSPRSWITCTQQDQQRSILAPQLAVSQNYFNLPKMCSRTRRPSLESSLQKPN